MLTPQLRQSSRKRCASADSSLPWLVMFLVLLIIQTSFALNDQEEVQDDDHHDHHHHHGHNSSHEFCQGSFMTMFMDGFHWSLGHSSSTTTTPCLVYYVRSWKLTASGKFRGAMVFSFCLALLTEGLAATRFAIIDYIHLTPLQNPRHRKLLLTFVYALQSWLGTLIMLVSMMYSWELLLSVVAGLMVGNYIFVRDNPGKRKRNGNGTRGVSPRRNSSSGGDPASSLFRGGNLEESAPDLSCCNPPANSINTVNSDASSVAGLQLQQQTQKED